MPTRHSDSGPVAAREARDPLYRFLDPGHSIAAAGYHAHHAPVPLHVEKPPRIADTLGHSPQIDGATTDVTTSGEDEAAHRLIRVCSNIVEGEAAAVHCAETGNARLPSGTLDRRRGVTDAESNSAQDSDETATS